MVGLGHYLILSAFIFTLGALGVLMRRNVLIILMSVELMLNAANLALIAFSRYLGLVEGQVIVLIVIVVAAAEAAVGLALVVEVFRQRRSIDLPDFNILKG
ncbi:NADH-quinone oxidoreductase subunit NuoK [candidate division KSB1 bacterium]